MSVLSCNHLLEMTRKIDRIKHYRSFLGNIYDFQSQPAAIVLPKTQSFIFFNRGNMKQTDLVSLGILAVKLKRELLQFSNEIKLSFSPRNLHSSTKLWYSKKMCHNTSSLLLHLVAV